MVSLTRGSWCVLVAVLASALPAVGCGGDDPSPVFVDSRWRVRCHLSDGCSDTQDRDINQLNGEEGHRLACSVARASESTQLLQFTAFKGTEYGIALRGAIFENGGGPVMGSGCVFEFEEQGNTYRAGCTASPPNEMAPCQVQGLSIENVAGQGPTISGQVRCERAPAVTNQTRTLELTGPGAGADAEASFASFEIANCPGT